MDGLLQIQNDVKSLHCRTHIFIIYKPDGHITKLLVLMDTRTMYRVLAPIVDAQLMFNILWNGDFFFFF